MLRGDVGREEAYRVGDLVVDVAGATVSRGDERIVLPPRTFELLVALVRRHPGTARRQALLDTVWRDEHVTDQTLSHRVMVLRKALGDHADEARYVSGERGFGYRLVAPVEALPEEADPAAGGRAGGRTRRLAVAGLLVAVAVAAAAGLLWRGPASLRSPALTVAVRPFERAPRLEPLAGELERAVERALRGVPGVRVLPREGASERPRLRVEGRWFEAGESVELRLRLVDEASRRAEWSRAFAGSLYELLAQGDEMGRAVAGALRRRAAPGTAPAAPGLDPRVRRLCWRGELYWLSFTEDGLRRSSEAWETAADLAPDRAAIHAGRSLTEAVRGFLGHLAPADAEARARAAATRALELEADLPAARLASSLVSLLFDWDAVGAGAAARTALEDDPFDPRGPVVLALALQAQGRLDESLALLEGAAEDDPHAAAALFLAGRAHEMKGRWSQGVVAYARALALEPGLAAARRGSAECLSAGRRDAEALVALGNAGARDGAGPADALRAAWRRRCRAGAATRDTIGACVLGGDPEEASRVLAAALGERRPFVLFVPQEALMRPLADQPPFQALLDRLGPGLRRSG